MWKRNLSLHYRFLCTSYRKYLDKSPIISYFYSDYGENLVIRLRLKLFLVVWSSLVFTSTRVEHTHTFQSANANHGIGFFSISGGFNELADQRHQHRILLGIEFPAEPCKNHNDADTVEPGVECCIQTCEPIAVYSLVCGLYCCPVVPMHNINIEHVILLDFLKKQRSSGNQLTNVLRC